MMIEATDLTKRFDDFIAVNKISFEVEKGDFFAFLGPNGAGKSTTIKMLVTLLDMTGGHVSIDGFDLKTQKDEIRDSFGIVFQDYSLDDELTAFENMYFHSVIYNVPKEDRIPRIEMLLHLVDLFERRKSLVKEFSGGMKRRLEIARGLLHEPKILFLDEPTLGLDPQTRKHIWDYIQKLNQEKGLTVFFTTHYMDEAERYASKIAIIDHGKIVEQGSVQDLLERTSKETLEEAFLSLTGYDIRDQNISSAEKMRLQRKRWRR